MCLKCSEMISKNRTTHLRLNQEPSLLRYFIDTSQKTSSSRWDNIFLIQFPLARPSYAISHWVSPHPHPGKKTQRRNRTKMACSPPPPPQPGLWKRQAEKTLGTHHQPFKVRSFAQWAVVLWSAWPCWAWWHRLIILSTQGAKTEGSQVQAQPGQLSKGLMQNKGSLWLYFSPTVELLASMHQGLRSLLSAAKVKPKN